MMEAKEAERRGLQAAGRLPWLCRGGLRARRDGHWPRVRRAPLLERHGLKVEDIALWELNEAFASQALYCQRQLGIPMERLNVNGGAISIGHPFGMTGARLAGHILLEGQRRKAKAPP
jgi:acetyl-CoA C-acetyltransferase